MLRALAIAFIALELAFGLAHTAMRLARAPAAPERGWPVLRPASPYTTRAGNIFRMVLQICGIHSE